MGCCQSQPPPRRESPEYRERGPAVVITANSSSSTSAPPSASSSDAWLRPLLANCAPRARWAIAEGLLEGDELWEAHGVLAIPFFAVLDILRGGHRLPQVEAGAEAEAGEVERLFAEATQAYGALGLDEQSHQDLGKEVVRWLVDEEAQPEGGMLAKDGVFRLVCAVRGLSVLVTQAGAFKRLWPEIVSEALRPEGVNPAAGVGGGQPAVLRQRTDEMLADWLETLSALPSSEREAFERQLRQNLRAQRHRDFGPLPDRWQVKIGESEEWWDFEEQDDAAIKIAVAEGKREVRLMNRGRFEYCVNLSQMTQRNLRTGRIRPVRPPQP